MNNIKPNCGPASVSHLLGEAVAVTMDRFRDQFKRYAGPRWQGYSYIKDCVSLLKRHGKVEEVAGRGSLKSFVENHTTPTGEYLIRVGGHMIAIKNQRVFDNWFDGADPADCKWSRKRVTHAYRFTSKVVERDDFTARLEASIAAGLKLQAEVSA